MGDQLDIPSCFVEVPRGYFCNVCKTTIAPSPDNSISRTIQKLRTHTSSKSHLRVASNQKITPFLQPESKPKFSDKKPDSYPVDLDEDVQESVELEKAESSEHGVDLENDYGHCMGESIKFK